MAGCGEAIGVAIAAGASMGMLNQVTTECAKHEYWYDFWHTYVRFGREATNLIDELLLDPMHGYIGNRLLISHKYLPGLGNHYYFLYPVERREIRYGDTWTKLHYMGFNKRREVVGSEEHYFYVAWYRRKTTIEFFSKRLFSSQGDNLRVISIDTSSPLPKLVFLTKILRPPRANQKKAIDLIMERYNSDNHFNVKIMLYGLRGVGKTFTAMVLKKEIESRHNDSIVQLFDDFNPCSIGVNIKTLALQRASRLTPIILVINEVDSVYDRVINDREPPDPREQHTRNRQSWHNMLDAINDTPNVITIFTTEVSPATLAENENYRSFMRKGRVDLFVEMTSDDAQLRTHNSVHHSYE